MQGYMAAQKSGELGMAWGVGSAQKARALRNLSVIPKKAPLCEEG